MSRALIGKAERADETHGKRDGHPAEDKGQNGGKSYERGGHGWRSKTFGQNSPSTPRASMASMVTAMEAAMNQPT